MCASSLESARVAKLAQTFYKTQSWSARDSRGHYDLDLEDSSEDRRCLGWRALRQFRCMVFPLEHVSKVLCGQTAATVARPPFGSVLWLHCIEPFPFKANRIWIVTRAQGARSPSASDVAR